MLYPCTHVYKMIEAQTSINSNSVYIPTEGQRYLVLAQLPMKISIAGGNVDKLVLCLNSIVCVPLIILSITHLFIYLIITLFTNFTRSVYFACKGWWYTASPYLSPDLTVISNRPSASHVNYRCVSLLADINTTSTISSNSWEEDSQHS